MYKSENIHSNGNRHEFISIEDAITFFAANHKVKIIRKSDKEMLIGLHNDIDTNDTVSLIDANVPDEVILITKVS